MIAPTAVFTCSICGEASTNICSFCTKDACSNHRCERCKRCSDCCECEYPLSAEEPVVAEVIAEAIVEPEAELPEAETPEESIPSQSPAPEDRSPVADFLTMAEGSVFVQPPKPSEPPDEAEAENVEPDEPPPPGA
jgi:hypothetical protein